MSGYRKLTPIDPTTSPDLTTRCMQRYVALHLFVMVDSAHRPYPKMWVWGKGGRLKTSITAKNAETMERRLDDWVITQCEYIGFLETELEREW